MRFLLMAPIKLYWKYVPSARRRTCIYSVSCSQHVYVVTAEQGLLKGIISLVRRIKTCRPGYAITELKQERKLILILSNGTVLQEPDISVKLVQQYRAAQCKHLNP